MKDSIKKFKNNDELINDLEKRNLIFIDEDSKKIFKSYLNQYGYFNFVKKTSNNLMYVDPEKKIFKNEFTSNNLRYLFDIDRNISIIFFKYFRNIEFLFSSSILKVISKNLDRKINCSYIAALDNESLMEIFPNIEKNIPYFKKWQKNTYLNFYDDLFKNFNNVDFNCREAINENINNEKNEIKEKIEKGFFRSFINKQIDKNFKTRKDWEYLDIFSLFQTISFSQLYRIFLYLSTSLKNEVIKIFFDQFKPKNKNEKLKEESFIELIEAFISLRNILMHNGYLIKFKYTIISEKNKKAFESYFDLDLPNSEIKLNEILLIIEKINNIEGKMFKEILESIRTKFENRTKRKDNVSNIIFEIINDETGMKIENN